MTKHFRALILSLLVCSSTTITARDWRTYCMFVTLYVYPAYVIYTNYTTPREERANLFHAIRYLTGACTMSGGVMMCCLGCYEKINDWCAKQERLAAQYPDLESRHVRDVSGPQDLHPIFLNIRTIQDIRAQRGIHPQSGNAIADVERTVVEAMRYWQSKGYTVQHLIELLRQPDPIAQKTHTAFASELVAMRDILGLSDQELEHILAVFPDYIVDVADLFEYITGKHTSLLPAPRPQYMS